MTKEIHSEPLEFDGGDYSVYWDGEALVICVNDYHAGPLRLPWKTVRALAKKAKKGMVAPLPGPMRAPGK